MRPEETSFRIDKPATIIVILATVVLLGILLFVFVFNNHWLDEEMFGILSDTISPSRTRIFKDISFLGSHRFLIPANLILIAIFIIKKYYWWAFRVGMVSLSSLGLMSLLKNLVQRNRPSMPLVDGITNFGFPSGHAFMSVAFFGILIVWAKESVTGKLHQTLIILFYIIMVLLIGFTRIYLRVHYTSDVIAGWSTGILWLVTCLFLLDRIKDKRIR